jgi:hypothetical protein
MLNELLLIERGAREAGLEAPERHQALKDVRRLPTLIVRLGAEGQVDSLQPLPRNVKPWTLRDGQQNSFPFVQNVPFTLPVLSHGSLARFWEDDTIVDQPRTLPELLPPSQAQELLLAERRRVRYERARGGVD